MINIIYHKGQRGLHRVTQSEETLLRNILRSLCALRNSLHNSVVT